MLQRDGGFADGGVAQSLTEQQLGKMQPKRYVGGRRGNSGTQTLDQG